MPAPKLDPATFAQMFESMGATRLARHLGITERKIYDRRRRIEAAIGRDLIAPSRVLQGKETGGKARLHASVKDGIVLVGSDPHYWPGVISTAHAAMVEFAQTMDPAIVIMNGDVVDGASIGRWPRIGWEYRPSFVDELEAVKDRLAEIEEAAPKAARYWPLGNHDARFENLISRVAPELERVHGVHLKDHFDASWNPCWSVWVNDNTIIKHRYKGGIHADRNNAVGAGKHIVTGHLHQGKYEPIPYYDQTLFGVSCPWMGENYGPQVIDYTEDNPVQWRSGITVLTYIDGELCEPEFAIAKDVGVVEFRGRRIKV
jgi:hypothetical protein